MVKITMSVSDVMYDKILEAAKHTKFFNPEGWVKISIIGALIDLYGLDDIAYMLDGDVDLLRGCLDPEKLIKRMGVAVSATEKVS